ncbi:MAG: hypothetical protein JRN37_00460 [Nitrososphaerota archaeon]|nr:hypothetical protein [Nitrososphaerota archaeon]MDG7036905.1 hypothetical protein [Nitrososphaerota archaeon]MDG7037623.1 hypothetical protein [Nitrososphaerota archaeon]
MGKRLKFNYLPYNLSRLKMENNKSLIIRDKLLEYGKHRHSDIDEKDTKGRIEDPNKHPLEFVFGVILDQGIKYEKAWSGPFELTNRLGHLDVKKNSRNGC